MYCDRKPPLRPIYNPMEAGHQKITRLQDFNSVGSLHKTQAEKSLLKKVILAQCSIIIYTTRHDECDRGNFLEAELYFTCNIYGSMRREVFLKWEPSVTAVFFNIETISAVKSQYLCLMSANWEVFLVGRTCFIFLFISVCLMGLYTWYELCQQWRKHKQERRFHLKFF